VSQAPSGGGGTTLPSWIFDLKPLAGVVTTLVTIATNPVAWFRRNLGELVVTEVLEAGGTLIGYGLTVVGIVTESISAAVGSFLRGLGPAGRAILDVPGFLYDPIRAVARDLGVAAPVVATVAVVVAGSLTVLMVRVYLEGTTQAALDAIPGAEGVNGVASAVRGWLR
jgi:hypothetical protein